MRTAGYLGTRTEDSSLITWHRTFLLPLKPIRRDHQSAMWAGTLLRSPTMMLFVCLFTASISLLYGISNSYSKGQPASISLLNLRPETFQWTVQPMLAARGPGRMPVEAREELRSEKGHFLLELTSQWTHLCRVSVCLESTCLKTATRPNSS